MTLVYRSSKLKPDLPKESIGPGSYNIQGAVSNSDNKLKKQFIGGGASSVFNSQTQRNLFEVNDINENSKRRQALINKFEEEKENNGHGLENGGRALEVELQLKTQKKCADCRSVFESKVQRFQSEDEKYLQRHGNSQQRTKEQILAEEFKRLLQKSQQDQNKGKLLGLKHKKQQQKALDEKYQAFPSIPNTSQSYGYRLDSQTQQLVANDNPNFLLQLKEKEERGRFGQKYMGPGYYFMKNNKSHGKMIMDWGHEKVQKRQKSSCLMEGMEKYPTGANPQKSALSHASNYNTIEHGQVLERLRKKKINHSMAAMRVNPSVATQVFEGNLSRNSGSLVQSGGAKTKNMLLAKKMLKQFGQYLKAPGGCKNGDNEGASLLKDKTNLIQQLDEIKRKKSLENMGLSGENGGDAIENDNNNHKKKSNMSHFLTKVKRNVKLLEGVEASSNNQNSSSKGENQDCLNNNSSQLVGSTVLKSSHNRAQPFLKQAERFKPDCKENIGPGSYEAMDMAMAAEAKNSKVLNGPHQKVTLNLKESRFGAECAAFSAKDQPGPGEYDVEGENGGRNKQMMKNHYQERSVAAQKVNNFHSRKDEWNMEAIYQNWGREMNYYHKSNSVSHSLNKKKKSNQKIYIPNRENEITHRDFKKYSKKRPSDLQVGQDTSEAVVAVARSGNEIQDNTLIRAQEKQNIQSNADEINRVKKSLGKQLSRFEAINKGGMSGCDAVGNDCGSRSPSKNNSLGGHPKIKEHLYGYTKQERSPFQELGPGSHNIRQEMVKKTFNVTYT